MQMVERIDRPDQPSGPAEAGLPTRAARRRAHPLALILGWALVAVSALFAARQAIVVGQPRANGTDFGFIWIAGKMWAEGLDPYGPTFAATSTRAFPATVGWSLVYPPQWWAIARPLGLLTFEEASRLWRLANVAFVAASGTILWWLSQRWTPPSAWPVRIAFLVLLLTAEQIGATFYLDQTSLMVLFGFTLFLAGVQRRRAWLGGIGLAILFLKPSFGAPLALIALATRDTRRALLVGLAISAAGCLPHLADGPAKAFERAGEFLHNLGGYNAPGSFNAPERMTGLFHLIPAVPPLYFVAAAGIVGLGLAMRLARDAAAAEADAAPAFLLAGTASLGAIAPLHNYDLAFVTCAILLVDRLRIGAAAMAVLGIVLVHSARRLSFGAGGGDATIILQAHIDTAGGLLLLAAAVLTAWRGWSPARSQIALGALTR